jgi:serine/threonine protein kinase
MLSQLTLKNHRHLARLLITYTLKDRFHLLCPFAKSNLRDYWKRNKQPMDRDSYLWTLQQISGLASALNQIHNFSSEATSREETVGPTIVNPVISRERPSLNVHLRIDPGEKYGRHGDLKPENILWFDDLEGVEEAGVLQITDFGLGRFHCLESRSKQDPKAINGSPTYSPPELPLGKWVNRGYDIWSFGCIFLEFITWIIYGYDGLKDFAEARIAMAHDGISDDTYYMLIISTSERGAVVREVVINWIAQLRRELRCSEMIGDLLDLAQQHMLRVDSKDRIQCKELDSKLKSMLEAAEANTFYLLGNITTTTIARKSNSNSTKHTSTGPSKRNLTLTDRSKSQQRKRR